MNLLKWPTQIAVIGTPADPNPPPPSPPPPPGGVGSQILRHSTPTWTVFNSTAWCNREYPKDGSLLIDAAASSAVSAKLVADASTGNRPYLGATKNSLPVMVVGPSQPRVPIKIHAATVPNYQKQMQQILLDPGVPLPDAYVNQTDSDAEAMVIEVDGSGNLLRIKEFWRLRPITPIDYTFTQSDGATVTYPGVKWECSSFVNYGTPATHLAQARNHNIGTYPNAPNPVGAATRLDTEDTNMQVAATQLPFAGTLLTKEDCDRGLDASGFLTSAQPDHLLNVSLIGPRSSEKWWPATRTDGYVSGSAYIEGMRLILDRTVYTDAAINAMSVHPLCRLWIKFVAVMGMIIQDKSGSTEFDAETGVHDLFNGTAPSAIMDGFPNSDIKVMAQKNADGTSLTTANPFPH